MNQQDRVSRVSDSFKITSLSHVPRARSLCGCLLAVALGACTHPQTDALLEYMHTDEAYLALPRGPQRVDALFTRASELGGSPEEGLDILGTLAVAEGAALKHPFNTGLTEDGVLSCPDKSGHFFAYAMWRLHDEHRLIPLAGTLGVFWEICGEVYKWFTGGAGFDMEDIWANRLGGAFAKELHHRRARGQPAPLPSEIIAEAENYRPTAVDPDAVPDCEE